MRKKARKRRWVIALVAVALLGAFFYGAGALFFGSSDDDPELIFDRTWLTPVPEGDREFLHAMIVIRAYDMGLFYKASRYRVEEELFELDHDARTLKMRFPQTGRRATVRYTVSACDDMPPFELCLDLNRNPWGGPRRYYAFRDDEDAEDHGFGPFLLHRPSPLLDRR